MRTSSRQVRSYRQAPVNLARRPFVNRRPIARLAAVMWLLGIGLMIVNVRLYSDHWRGKAMNNRRLAEVDRELSAQSEELAALDQKLRPVNLRRQNRQTEFLNSLIAYRTFPWSSLFDDLEDVLPRQVRLLSVKPSVKLAAEPDKPRRRRPPLPRRRRPSSADATEEGGEETASEPAAPTPKRDEVSLQLTAVAESEDALYELIDRLYASPSFRAPFLPGENRNLDSGSTSFSVNVLYLTRPGLPAEAVPPPAEEAAEGADLPGEIALMAPPGEASAPPAAARPPRSEELDRPATEELDRPATEPAAATGGTAAPAPTAGLSIAEDRRGASSVGRRQTARPRAGAPPSGVPASGSPSSGAASSGRPASRATPEDARGRPPAEEPPENPADQEPPFAEPPASATPRVRRGSLLADPFDPLAPWRPRVRPLEVAA